MTNPTLITTPFAENGDKNIIPESVAAEPQNATMQTGFPPITQQKISEGGIPPERNDFNGMFNLVTQHLVHLNKGLPYEFDQDFANKIGGYPLNARLMLDNGDIVQSTIANNVNNPNSDMTGWSYATSRIKTFESISELTSSLNPKDGDIANVLSYHSGLGKGGGWFVYDSSQSSVNNGVTIFNGWVRDLANLYLSTYDAGLHGVVATDGDSTEKLQALASACNDGFKVDFIGAFKVSTSIVFAKRSLKLTHIKLLEDDEIYGDPATWAFTGPASQRGVLQLNGGHNSSFKNFKIKGVKKKRVAASPATGIDSVEDGDTCIMVVASHNVKYINNYVYNAWTWGIASSDSNYGEAIGNTVKNCVSQSGINISWSTTQNLVNKGSRYIGNTIEDCGIAGLELEGQGAIVDCVVRDNTVNGCRVGLNLTPHNTDSIVSEVNCYNNNMNQCDYGILFNSSEVGLTDYIFTNNDLKNCRINYGISASTKYVINGGEIDGSAYLNANLYVRRSAHDRIFSIIDGQSFYVVKKQNSMAGVIAGSKIVLNNNIGAEYTVAEILTVPITDWMNPVNASATELYKVTLTEPINAADYFDGSVILYSKLSTSYLTYISTNTKSTYNGLITGLKVKNLSHGIRGAETTFVDKTHEITSNTFKNVGYYVYNEYSASTAWHIHDNVVYGASTQSKCFQVSTMLTSGSLVPNGVRTVRLPAQGAFGYVWFPRNVQTIQARVRIFGGNMGATTSTVMALQLDGTGVGNKTITTLTDPSIYEWQIDQNYSGLSDFGQMSVRIIFGAGDVTFSYAEVELFYI